MNWVHIFSLYSTVCKITSVIPNKKLKRSFPSEWDQCFPLLQMPKLALQNGSISSVPFPLVRQSSSILISLWVRGRARLGWLFSDFTRTRDRSVHVPTVASLSKPWKTDFFFHNWHRLCLGQEPNINYKDWPQPRELKKNLDNTNGKLFPHMNWHLKYVLVLCTICYITEPNLMGKIHWP